MNTPAITTERLILRKFTEKDLGALFAIYSDEEVNTFLPWFPLKNMAEARRLFEEKYAAEYEKPSGYRYAVCLREDNIPIGYIHAQTDDSHDFGYGLLSSFQGKGIMTEAGGALIETLREAGVPYITATHDVKNPRSGEVMKRLGMEYRYSYEEQWQPKDIPFIFRMYQFSLDGKDRPSYSKYWDVSSVRFVEKEI